MATSQKATPAPKSKNKTVTKSVAKSGSLFPAEVLYSLKLGSVQVPFIEDGKGVWRTVTQGQWDLKSQRALIGYWEDQKKENATFNIEAKKAKLFIMPAESVTAATETEEVEVEVELAPDDENNDDNNTGAAEK